MKVLPSVVVLFLLCACASTSTVVVQGSRQVTYTVEVADSVEEHAIGLMGRDHLPQMTGMLFVFAKDGKLAFWMKDTLIPLDVLFINSNNTIVKIASMVPCEKDPCTVYPSEEPAQYALEIPAGDAQRYGFKEGQQVAFNLRKD